MGLLKCGEMRKLGQAQEFLKFLHVRDDRDDPAIVRLEELLQGEQGQQLVLGELAFGELRGIGRKPPASDPQGHPGQRLGRTRHAACGAHSPLIGPPKENALGISTEQLQSSV